MSMAKVMLPRRADEKKKNKSVHMMLKQRDEFSVYDPRSY